MRETHWTLSAAVPKICAIPILLTFDVTAGVGTGERLAQAAWAFLPPRPADAVAPRQVLASSRWTTSVSARAMTRPPQDRYHTAPRPYLEGLFYAGEVPRQVIDADTAAQSRLPLRAGAEVATPGFVERYAPQVDVPVFLGFGAAVDVSPDPYCEPANYTGAADVTLFLVSRSGHCHNFASHRHLLWDRIAAWVPTVT